MRSFMFLPSPTPSRVTPQTVSLIHRLPSLSQNGDPYWSSAMGSHDHSD